MDIDKSDITGSLLRMILSGSYEIEYSMSDWIDIKVELLSILPIWYDRLLC